MGFHYIMDLEVAGPGVICLHRYHRGVKYTITAGGRWHGIGLAWYYVGCLLGQWIGC